MKFRVIKKQPIETNELFLFMVRENENKIDKKLQFHTKYQI